MSEECTHWCGHQFEARYDMDAPALTKLDHWGGSPESLLDFVESTKRKTYVRDVCVRCGRTIERDKEAKQ